jgi:hypothetical protein
LDTETLAGAPTDFVCRLVERFVQPDAVIADASAMTPPTRHLTRLARNPTPRRDTEHASSIIYLSLQEGRKPFRFNGSKDVRGLRATVVAQQVINSGRAEMPKECKH